MLPRGTVPLLKYLVPKAAQAKIKALHLGYKVFPDSGILMGFLNNEAVHKIVREFALKCRCFISYLRKNRLEMLLQSPGVHIFSSWLSTHALHFYSSHLVSCLLAVSPTRLSCLGAWWCSAYHLCLVLSIVNVHTLNVHWLDIALILIPAEGMNEYWPKCIFFYFKKFN